MFVWEMLRAKFYIVADAANIVPLPAGYAMQLL